MTRTALLSLVLTLVQGTGLPAQDNGSGPFVAAALLVPGGPAVYLGSGLLLTAAHLVNPGADISVVIARAKLPAKVLKQGAYEDKRGYKDVAEHDVLHDRIATALVSLRFGGPIL